jgi:hypothetical protein
MNSSENDVKKLISKANVFRMALETEIASLLEEVVSKLEMQNQLEGVNMRNQNRDSLIQSIKSYQYSVRQNSLSLNNLRKIEKELKNAET